MELFAHQKKILLDNPPRHLLAWGTGTGKTGTALSLYKQNATTCLVVCPKTLKENWRREVKRWLDEDAVLFDPKDIRKLGAVLIMSKEEFRKFWGNLPAYEAVIIDEAHTFAGIQSQLSKNAIKYLKYHNIKFRWLLTATPYLRNAWNVYMLGKLLGYDWNYAAFRIRFFYERYMGARTFWDARPGMQDEVAELVHQIGTTVKLEDCIDIPDAVYEEERFKLTPQQKAAMKAVKESLPIVRFTKLHQICGGVLKGNEYEPARYFASDKLSRLKELVEENDKIIISCRYLAEMDMILHATMTTERRHYLLNGETEDRQTVLDRFNADPTGILIVNAAVSEGWQAPSCPLIVFYSYDFSLKNKIQMEGRIRRIDRPQKVTYIALTCEDSIDEAVSEALGRKQDFDAAIYDYKLKQKNG